LYTTRLNAPNSISAGAPPRPYWGAYSAPPDPLAGYKVGNERKRKGWIKMEIKRREMEWKGECI